MKNGVDVEAIHDAAWDLMNAALSDLVFLREIHGRSEEARRIAIVLTDLQRTMAIFSALVKEPKL